MFYCFYVRSIGAGTTVYWTDITASKVYLRNILCNIDLKTREPKEVTANIILKTTNRPQ